MKKASDYKTHKSLDEFCMKYPSRIGERILLYTKDNQKDGGVTCLPMYYGFVEIIWIEKCDKKLDDLGRIV